MTSTIATKTTSRSPFALRDFRLLWAGEAVSALGDQFALIALPWLALLLTGSAFALGTVLALMAVPRAVLMLVGGAYVDRLSPRRVMLLSNAVRLVAVSVLGAIALVGGIEMWMLYIFAVVFGIADAFFYPAQTAMVPDLVDDEQLQQANGIVQGTAQLSLLIGPALAGIAIAALDGGTTNPALAGVGIALLIDGATFLASLLTLLLISRRPAQAATGGSVVQEIAEGIRFVWRAPVLRVMMLISMGLNLFIVGPTEVGLPLLAYSRLPEGAVAFGLMMSAFGGGSLLGLGAATLLPALPPARFGSIVLALISLSGLALAALALAKSTLVVLMLTGAIGVILGYTNLAVITWVQRRVPQLLMGRVMSLLMFSSLALVPVSMAVAGALVQVSLDGVFLVAGLAMTALPLSALLSGRIRRMGLEATFEEDAPSTGETAVGWPVGAD